MSKDIKCWFAHAKDGRKLAWAQHVPTTIAACVWDPADMGEALRVLNHALAKEHHA